MRVVDNPRIRWQIGLRVPERLLIAPQDLRTGDPTIANEVYAGEFAFAGKVIVTEGRTPFEIEQRMTELAFNASLLSQMRSIDFINHLLADGRLQEGSQYRKLLLHRIDVDSASHAPLSAASKMSADIRMIEALFESGRAAAGDWLAQNFDALGRHSTIDIQQDYVAGSVTTPLSPPVSDKPSKRA